MVLRCTEIEFEAVSDIAGIGSQLEPQHVKRAGWSTTIAEYDEGFVVSDGPNLAKIKPSGEVIWNCTLPIDGRVIDLCLSDDRILLTTGLKSYGAWGTLGPVFLLDFSDGRMVAKLRGDRIAGLSDGRFLVGLSGYDYFHTWLYDRSGEQLLEWPSYGHYLVENGDERNAAETSAMREVVRVLEISTTKPSSARYVRLLDQGDVERGPKLTHIAYCAPVSVGDGVVVTLDSGDLYAYDRALNALRIRSIFPYEDEKSHCYLIGISGDKTDLIIELQERSLSSNDYQYSRWRLRLSDQ
ncbi:MAG: hypothetical protein ACRBBW_17985 [Cellvibrionaceae bacterium]